MDLTQDSFDRLLFWLHPDHEEAGKVYEKIRLTLIRTFASHGCLLPDKLADKTIDRVAAKLPLIIQTWEGRPDPYFHRVGYYVLLEYFASKKDEVELGDDVVLEDQDDIEPEFACLEKCIGNLTQSKQELIRKYYRGDKAAKIRQRRELAISFNLELPVLRVKVLRIRTYLKECIENCLETQGR